MSFPFISWLNRGLARADAILLRKSFYDAQAARAAAVEALDADLQQLRKSLFDAQGPAVQALGDDLQRLRRIVLHDQRVDVVRNGPLLVPMYVDDLAYQSIPRERRSSANPQVLQAFDLEESRRAALTPCVHYDLAQAFARRFDDFLAIDVGCQYGTSAITLARYLRSIGKTMPVIAFDPGDAGRLAPTTIEMNDAADEVHFYPQAVGARDGFAVLFHEFGNSENNRIVNAIPESLSRIVRTVSLDSFLESHYALKPALVKIDTQGAEPEVLAGAGRLLRTCPTVLLMEYTPWAIRTRTDPVAFLARLQEDFHIYRLVDHVGTIASRTSGLALIAPGEVPQFTAMIDDSSAKWTDVVLVSKLIEAADELICQSRRAA